MLVVLIVLYVGSQLASGLLSSASMDRNQRMIMLGLPIVFVAFIINFPAGLLVYWITTNCWTIVQQLIVRKTVGVPRSPRWRPPGRRGRGGAARGGEGGGASGKRALGRRPGRPRRSRPPQGQRQRRQRQPARRRRAERRSGQVAGDERARRERGRRARAADAGARSSTRSASTPRSRCPRTPTGLHANLDGEDLGLLIGRHGQTIDAIQHLAYRDRLPRRGRPQARDGRRRRLSRAPAALLQQDADEAVERRCATGEPVALDAMNAVERRVVHEYLRDRDGIETYSEGAEPDRHLVVAPVDAQ